MAFITYPLNMVDYTAEDAELFHCTRNSGIYADDDFQCVASGVDNTITVGEGIGWIRNSKYSGKVFANKTAEVVDLGLADASLSRYDVVAVQFNKAQNLTKIVVKNGTPASSPTIPERSVTESIYELYLCKVYRPVGALTITADNVTDTRLDAELCGLMADSVTSVDTSAIDAQVKALITNLEAEIQDVKDTSGLMFESEWVDNGAIPIPKGGTGADSVAEARQNLNCIGLNPIASINDDTTANWAAMGTGVAYISKTGLLANQPSPYGYVENRVYSSLIFQTFHSMNGKSPVWYRSGNASGWYTASANWVRALDENNGIQIKKLWENASPSSAFGNQTLTIDLSDYDLVKIHFNLDGNQRLSNAFDTPLNRACLYEISSYTRHFTVYPDRIVFETCTNADKAIPYKIYGIKGVQ